MARSRKISARSSSSSEWRAHFCSKIGDCHTLVGLFDQLHDVYFFMKDRDGRFVAANPLQVEKLGQATEADVLGKTDLDFFPRDLVATYREDDTLVMETGQPLIKKVEVVTNPDGSMDWHLTSKSPVRDRQGRVIGIAGFMRRLDQSARSWQPYRDLQKVIDFLHLHYVETIRVERLAKLLGLSVSQFERRFQRTFHMSPSRFLTRLRVTRACERLINTDGTLTQIALEVGFFDHSHFSRAFKRLLGVAPGEYRRLHTG